MKTIGVLAFQGAFVKHYSMLARLDIQPVEVRRIEELRQCDALILPGGESTTVMRHIHEAHMEAPLREFAHTCPLFGTCAGMIVMNHLGILDLALTRNAYGRQKFSFISPLSLSFSPVPFEGIFIRAPVITQLKSAQVLAQVSHQHSGQFGQTVLLDAEENPEGRVDLTRISHHFSGSSHTRSTEQRFSPRTCEKSGLASLNQKAVLIKQGRHMAATFHPELTNDTRIHQYFINNLSI